MALPVAIAGVIALAAGPSPGPTARADVTLHVSPDGADGALTSLQDARDAIRQLRATGSDPEPITVWFADGLYPMAESLVLEPQDGGTSDAPITYRAAPGARPVFSGGLPIDGFVEGEDGVWRTRIPAVAEGRWTFDQLFVNGRRATPARTPDVGFFQMASVEEQVHEAGDRVPKQATQVVGLRAEDLALLPELDPDQLATVQMLVFHKWDTTRRFLEKLDLEARQLQTSGTGMKPWNSWRPGTRFRLERFASALTVPGEWFLAPDGELSYLPREGERLEEVEVIAPVLDRFLEVRGRPEAGEFVEHVRFEGLTFQHAAYVTPPEGFEAAQAAAPIDAVILLDGARHVTFTGCELRAIGRYGVWFRRGCRDCRWEHSLIQDMGAGGVRIGETVIREQEQERTGHIVVDNNILRNGGHVFPCAVGVWIGHSADNQVTHNDIGDLYYTGVSVGWCWGYGQSLAQRNQVEFNHIHHIGKGLLSDMGGVYTLGPSAGTRVSHNWIHDVWSYDYGGWGLYTDEGSTGIRMEGNLVHDVKSGGFHQHYGRDNVIVNNILAFSTQHQVQLTRAEAHRSFTFERNIVLWEQGPLLKGAWLQADVAMDRNCYWNLAGADFDFVGKSWQEWRAAGRDRHSIAVDPGFADPAARDFRLGEDSPALELGFERFDPSAVGVYGEPDWIAEARRG